MNPFFSFALLPSGEFFSSLNLLTSRAFPVGTALSPAHLTFHHLYVLVSSSPSPVSLLFPAIIPMLSLGPSTERKQCLAFSKH